MALAAPDALLDGRLPEPPANGRTFVAALGKAAAAMAQAVERRWPDDCPLHGLAVTRDGHGAACRRIEVMEASHPVPDHRSQDFGARLLAEARALGEHDLLLCLLSGGGSALAVVPAPGIALAEKQGVNRALLASGAPIGAMNVVRRHMSAIKGGRLALAAWPAVTHTLAISDVPGDDPATIASGPTVGDPTSVDDAARILADLAISFDVSRLSESPAPSHPHLARSRYEMLATPGSVLERLLAEFDRSLFDVIDLGAGIEGEARDVAATHAALAAEVAATASRPALVVSGGETTVTVASHATPGAGGRNTEYLLALALALETNGTSRQVWALAADSDGIDGSEADAGALLRPDSLRRARAEGLDPAACLASHDSHTLFRRVGDLVTSGPTRTNVNDFRALLVLPSA